MIQYLEKLKQAKKGLTVIAVSLGDEEAVLKKWALKHKLTFPVVLTDDPNAEKYGVTKSGTIMLVNDAGEITVSELKLLDAKRKAFEKKVDAALAE